MGESPTLGARCLAEGLGTYVLIFFGCGAVHAAVLTGAQAGVWQVAIVWGVAVMLAVFMVGGISGAHINPAITIATAVWGKTPGRFVAPYIVSQFVGAFLAAATLFAIFHGNLAAKEQWLGVERGQPGSVLTASCYGEFFPTPAAGKKPDEGNIPLYVSENRAALDAIVSPVSAFVAEVVGTMLLALAVFSLTDERNNGRPPGYLAPILIGLIVALIISVIGPLTGSCLNPARDFGPRVFTAVAGWGEVALPGPNGIHVFTVYLIAPIAGALAGGALHTLVLAPRYPRPETPNPEPT